MIDPYRCTCGTAWPVRVLAEDCCQPDRPARIAARLEEQQRRKDQR